MPNPLRCYLPGTIFEVTTRTLQERFLMRPSAMCRAIIIGVLARAQEMFPSVAVHAFTFLSNHYHMMCSADCGQQFSEFMAYVNSNVARKLSRLHGWRGKFWGARMKPVPILDPAAQIERLKYIFLNGVKEGLVASPLQWPGASSAVALVSGAMEVEGIWVDQDGYRRARRKDPNARIEDFTSHPVLRLAPLPAWQHLAPSELPAMYRTLVEEIENAASGQSFMGAAAVEQQDPFDRPDEPKGTTFETRRPAPLCHSTSLVLRSRYRRAYYTWVMQYRERSVAARGAAVCDLWGFPEGFFPRPHWYRPAAHPDAFQRLVRELAS